MVNEEKAPLFGQTTGLVSVDVILKTNDVYFVRPL